MGGTGIRPFHRRESAVILGVFVAVIAPTAFLIVLGLFGPPPYLLDRDQFGHYLDKARIRQEAKVELKLTDSHGAAEALAERYVSGKAKRSYVKTLNEHRYIRQDNGRYEIVMPIEEAVVRVEGQDREHAAAVFTGLPFVVENPEKNIVWELFTKYPAFVFGAIGLYTVVLLFGFSRWHSAIYTVAAAPHRAPLSEESLRQALMGLSEIDLPFTVQRDSKRRIVVEWKIADAKWRELLGRGGLSVAHRITLSFDRKDTTVRAVQTGRRFQHHAGLLGAMKSFAWTRTVNSGYEAGAAYGILRTADGWRPAEAYRYRYVPAEITQPVVSAVVESGWRFKPVYTFFRPLGG